MNGYLLPLTCPHCGGVLDHVNAVTRAGTEAVAVAKCSTCSREFTVSVQLRPLALPPAQIRADRRALA